MLIDEVHSEPRVPDLLYAINEVVDDDPAPGKLSVRSTLIGTPRCRRRG